MHRPEADRHPIPGIDGSYQEGRLYHLFLAEIPYVPAADPAERAFGLRHEIDPPHGDRIEI
jgi:hypothetical protein